MMDTYGGAGLLAPFTKQHPPSVEVNVVSANDTAETQELDVFDLTEVRTALSQAARARQRTRRTVRSSATLATDKGPGKLCSAALRADSDPLRQTTGKTRFKKEDPNKFRKKAIKNAARETLCALDTTDLVEALPQILKPPSENPTLRPLPLEGFASTKLIGGPTGHESLWTPQCCKSCGYSLANLSQWGGLQAYVIANSAGTECYHFYCATQNMTNEAPFGANDWLRVAQSPSFGGRGLFLWMIHQ